MQVRKHRLELSTLWDVEQNTNWKGTWKWHRSRLSEPNVVLKDRYLWPWDADTQLPRIPALGGIPARLYVGVSVRVRLCMIVGLGVCFKRNNPNRKRQPAKQPLGKTAKRGVMDKVAKPRVCRWNYNQIASEKPISLNKSIPVADSLSQAYLWDSVQIPPSRWKERVWGGGAMLRRSVQ